MKLEWMGKYRELVRSVVYFSNCSNRNVLRGGRGDYEPHLNQHEWQVLEYICEFEDDCRIMADISRDLGIIPSNITKATRHLLELELIEKNRIVGNRKNVVLTPTDEGKRIYYKVMESKIRPVFDSFFAELSGFDSEQLKTIENAFYKLSHKWAGLAEPAMLEKTDE